MNSTPPEQATRPDFEFRASGEFILLRVPAVPPETIVETPFLAYGLKRETAERLYLELLKILYPQVVEALNERQAKSVEGSGAKARQADTDGGSQRKSESISAPPSEGEGG